MKCRYCDNEATRLCDFILDRQTGRTCDKPLCDDHAVEVGRVMLCQRSGPGRGCRPETIDHCPGHAHTPGGKPPFRPIGGEVAA